MKGFRQRADVDAVQDLLRTRLAPLPAEMVTLPEASGRVLAEDIKAQVAVPGFARAAMDGYALRATETFGAATYNILELRVAGQSLPARPFLGQVGAGEAVRIMTGAPLPAGADAVLPAEAAEEVLALSPDDPPLVRIREDVPPGRHVSHIGEDIQPGSTVVHAGRVLRPQDVGVLASIGASPVAVRRQPRVAILVTGDELLPCGSRPEGFRIVDSNSVMLRALVRRDGGIAGAALMVPDCYEAVYSALQTADADVVLISGGSSVGMEDHAPRVLAELGELPVHGVALRPASPTGVGFLGARPVILLPGNPVSCLCAYDLFVGRAIQRLGGRPERYSYRSIALPLARKIASTVGRVDYVRVQVRNQLVEPLAVGGASLLSSTTRADGFVLVPRELEGYAPGQIVEVYLYDQD
jgi:molybdopterin molybdotransferase